MQNNTQKKSQREGMYKINFNLNHRYYNIKRYGGRYGWVFVCACRCVYVRVVGCGWVWV